MTHVIEPMGFNKIWFGILTPPLGLGVFAVAVAVGEDVSIKDVFRGAFPFVIMMLITLAILILFPGISTLLPSLM